MEKGNFCFVRGIALEDAREILSELAGRHVTEVDYYEPYFTGNPSLNKKLGYRGRIERDDDGTFSFKDDIGTFRNIDYKIANLQAYDVFGRTLGGKIHHVEIKL